MPSSDPAIRFQDILDSIADIESFTAGMSKADFAADRKTRLAVERCLSILSEATVKLGSDAERVAPAAPWRDIRGLGNHIRHAYEMVNEDTLWDIIVGDLKPLRLACLDALAALKR